MLNSFSQSLFSNTGSSICSLHRLLAESYAFVAADSASPEDNEAVRRRINDMRDDIINRILAVTVEMRALVIEGGERGYIALFHVCHKMFDTMRFRCSYRHLQIHCSGCTYCPEGAAMQLC